MTYLTVPISAETLQVAGRQIKAALSAGAEMLELRTDYLVQLSVDMVSGLIAQAREASGARVPILVTCRDSQEGGARPYPEELRLDVLLTAVDAGAEFVDCEYATFTHQCNADKIRTALSARPGCRLILSAHDFQGPFRDMGRLYRDIRKACPEAIPKLVYTANHINDCFEAFDLLHETSGDRIVLCMGEAGLISRLVAKKLGGFVTFASLDAQAATAPGQLTVTTLKSLYRHGTIDADTQLFGVVGDPVGHSMSPAIHNACFADARMNRLYLPLLVQNGEAGFNQFLDHVLARPWLDFRGFSVTIPHKHIALKYMHEKGGFVEPLADQIGAANTLILPQTRAFRVAQPPPAGGAGVLQLSACNTDYAGALDAITTGMGIERQDLRDVRVAVVGAGGVSRALVAGLTDAGAKVTIYNRTVERAEELATEFGCQFAGLDQLPTMNAQLLVNCTSLGMHPNVNATPIPTEYLKPDMTIFDTVYNPPETLLLKQARQKGARTIDGVAMFVNQAAAQFQLFTGQVVHRGFMREVVLRNLR